jgi:hypothetical protein
MSKKSIGVIFILVLLIPAFAVQTRTPETPRRAAQLTAAPAPDPQFAPRRNQDEPIEVRLERERLKAWNKERYENLKKDTDKLLELATQLKESVDKANKDMLSLEVIRKTEEVEKLAKQVRQKMKAI